MNAFGLRLPSRSDTGNPRERFRRQLAIALVVVALGFVLQGLAPAHGAANDAPGSDAQVDALWMRGRIPQLEGLARALEGRDDPALRYRTAYTLYRFYVLEPRV